MFPASRIGYERAIFDRRSIAALTGWIPCTEVVRLCPVNAGKMRAAASGRQQAVATTHCARTSLSEARVDVQARCKRAGLDRPCGPANWVLRATPKLAAPPPAASRGPLHHAHSTTRARRRGARGNGLDARRLDVRRYRNDSCRRDVRSPGRQRSRRQWNAEKSEIRFCLTSRCFKS